MGRTAVYTFTDKYMLPAACCALLSVARHSRDRDMGQVIVGIDLSPEHKASVAAFNARHGSSITIVDFTLPTDLPEASGRWTKATLARLYIDEIIDESIDRVLYIDADVLVVDPIDAIFQSDLHGNVIGAVDDYVTAFPDKAKKRELKLGLRHGPRYFNAGVILLDSKAVRTTGLFKMARELLQSGARYDANDQDVLNIAFQGAWEPLNPRWNVQTGIMPFVRDPVIVHFTGRRKPWQSSIRWMHTPYAHEYRQMLLQTSWAEFVKERRVQRKIADLLLSLGGYLGGVYRAGKVKAYFGDQRRLPDA
ncbi:glycosyltransferase family 8 protein (plasmid) [Rhizobium sullae]|uniref:Glycosyltransferase family 8 protein n=1 Tax=Rhizobium sullae TaxID=50338 RepID=A0ABY5XQC1_RHISU|nr:glycosyltransferase family 8 protein [Rhizobium sullae]UWU16830.1 glycosyltransferase family 8 protein [Rhizobium sullae]